MTYDNLKETIMNRIKKQKTFILEQISKANNSDDWEEIKDNITFIIQAYGAIQMIEHVKEVAKKFDEENLEEKSSPETKGLDET